MSNTTAVKRTTTRPGISASNLTTGDMFIYHGDTYRTIKTAAYRAGSTKGYTDITAHNMDEERDVTITLPSSYRFTVLTVEEPAEQAEATEQAEAADFTHQQYAGHIEPGTITPVGTVESHHTFRNDRGRWTSRINYTSGHVEDFDYHAIIATDR